MPQEQSLRESLSAALDSQTEGASTPPTPSPAPAPEAATPSPAPASGGEETSTPSPSPSPASDSDLEKDSATAAAAIAAGRPIPERLKAKWADKWETLDQGIRDEFHSYESHIGGLASKYGKAAKAWERAQQVYAPYAALVEAEGGDFHAALGNLFETARILRAGAPAQKVALVQAMAQSFNIPAHEIVRALGGQLGTSEGGAPAAAPSSAAEPDLNLLNRLTALERRILTREGQEAHNIRTHVASETETFLADPAHAYVREPGFTDTMAQLLESGAAESLQDAYEKATWIVPSTRSLEIAKGNKARMDEERQRAARAKGAAVSLPGNSPGTGRRDTSTMDLRATLAAALDGELS